MKFVNMTVDKRVENFQNNRSKEQTFPTPGHSSPSSRPGPLKALFYPTRPITRSVTSMNFTSFSRIILRAET